VRFLLSTVGSSGDVNPFIAVGCALQARGHVVAMLANPFFESTVTDAGLEFLPLGDEFDFKIMARLPGATHPRRGGITILRELVFPVVPLIVETVEKAIGAFKPDLVLSHQICIGTPWACERRGVPCATVVLSPAMWLNRNDPAVYMQGGPQNPGPFIRRLNMGLARVAMRHHYDRPLNRLRRQMGFTPIRDMVFHDAHSGVVNLGLWSPHMRPSLEGDPALGKICGFAWHDRFRKFEGDDWAGGAIGRFLGECERAGERPIIFSLGTAVVHVAGRFYHDAAEACRRLGRRALLLTNRPEYAPTDRELPTGVQAFNYAPFSEVLARGCCTVHHGGMGTTAQAMRAGRPTVIVPHAYDQFDCAARTRRMGVSETVFATRVTPERPERHAASLRARNETRARRWRRCRG
jgi:UDP:flavonoid glycosyltransferase YjiC (YdhE family)